VAETAGLAVCYAGRPVETPYCSTCGGYTQAARDVWGQDIPYLQPVPCRWDAHSPRAESRLLLSLAEAAKRLAVNQSALPAMSASCGAGGALSELKVGEKKYSGLQLRQMLSLPSANCQWLIEGENILFCTRGFGHGVGLCQYGADGMAREGHTAEEILLHYYQGVEINALYW
jgi:stage II sporulation protein D